MKLVISASPHIDSGATTRKIMGDVLIALCPALIAAVIIFGWRALLVTAGIVWIVAGANILRIGVVTWASQSHYGLFRAGEAIVVFLLFFNLVFKRLFYKHTQRIERKGDRNCPFSFFDAKGWIVMCFMILFGILARTCRWLPETFIAVFYTGLSAALIVTGVLFLRYRYRNKDRL